MINLKQNENKLSHLAYNDIKWNENKVFWSKKIESLLDQIGLGEFWMKAEGTLCGHRNRKHDQATI